MCGLTGGLRAWPKSSKVYTPVKTDLNGIVMHGAGQGERLVQSLSVILSDHGQFDEIVGNSIDPVARTGQDCDLLLNNPTQSEVTY